MTDSPEPTAAKSNRAHIRSVAIGAAVFLIAAAAIGWILHAAWKARTNAVAQAVDANDVARSFEQSLESFGKEFEKAGEFSSHFVTDLADGHLSDAYQATSKSFQRNVNEARFTKLVQGLAEIKEGMIQVHFAVKQGSSKFNASGDLWKNITQKQVAVNIKTNDPPTAKLNLVLVEENGSFKVDSLELGSDKAP